MNRIALALLLALLPAVAQADIVFYYTTGASLYVRFDDASNTAVNLTEGSSLKAGRYTVADAAIDSAGLAAGTYTGRILIGTAGAQTGSDVEVGVLPEFIFGASTQTTSYQQNRNTLMEATLSSFTTNGTLGQAVNWLKAAFTSSGVFSEPSLVNAPAGEGGLTIPVNQVAVPASRTWLLVQTADGLQGEESRGMKVGETKVFAFDFQKDLPTNGRLENVESIAISSGTADGVTFADDASDPGVDKTQAKVSITAAVAGTYEVECTVGYQSGDGGGSAKGVVTLIVTD